MLHKVKAGFQTFELNTKYIKFRPNINKKNQRDKKQTKEQNRKQISDNVR